ncbi:MAG: family 10 glycosylhydrolase, partial [Verrucomicrobiae bacterium]|nr:family 10 glycosylhydrolase [Verrucomicrobiae bacterium]
MVPAILTSILSGLPQSPELRGWWVDAWHPGLRNPAEVEALVKTAREANFNALFVQVRRRGDAYYLSRFEPKSSEVQIGFDPLAHLIKLAHDTSLGPRVDVHAWIVTYNIWHDQLAQPTQPNHPYRLYPDWLTESYLSLIHI